MLNFFVLSIFEWPFYTGFTQVMLYTAQRHLLASVCKEALDPLLEVSSDSVMMQFDCEALMTNIVLSYTEIEENDIILFIFLHGRS